MQFRPSPSMVVAVTALVVAASGTAIAASALTRGDQLIAKRSLSGNRLRNHTLTGKQINLHKLGKVPSASNANHATSATSAVVATIATNALNATELGGKPVTAYQGKTLWALIDGASGDVIASSGGITDYHPQTGFYYVNFGTPMVSRPIDVTLNHFAGEIEAGPCVGTGTPQPGEISCASFPSVNTTDNVSIGIETTTNSLFDSDFYVVSEAP